MYFGVQMISGRIELLLLRVTTLSDSIIGEISSVGLLEYEELVEEGSTHYIQ
jgi:hypothetical protein